jgi:hypothetical protein
LKLLTDERAGADAFKSDFTRACRKMARVLIRRGDSPSEVAIQLIEAVRDAMDWQQTGGAHHVDNWNVIELFHAMDWLMVIVARWLDSQADGPGSMPRTLDERAAEMFMMVAQRVADEITEGRYSAPDPVRKPVHSRLRRMPFPR